jgi:hypothetical protein
LTATVHRANAPSASLITAERYNAALTFAEYLESVAKNREWWQSTYRVATVADADIARAQALPRQWRLVAISEDWCGDAVNILPYVGRLVDAAPNTLQLRVLGRDANSDVMETHLTGRSRSIPVVIALDADYLEHGWWGPRPVRLQLQAMGEWWLLHKDERRTLIRTWYARDHGRQVIDELLQLLNPVSPLQ